MLEDQELSQFKDDIISGVVHAMKSFNIVPDRDHLDAEWVDQLEARKILGYSKTKMQELRNSGAIVYSKFGRKIKYKRQSLIDFIEKNVKTKEDHYGI